MSFAVREGRAERTVGVEGVPVRAEFLARCDPCVRHAGFFRSLARLDAPSARSEPEQPGS